MRKKVMFLSNMIIRKLLILSILVVGTKSYVITNSKDGQNQSNNNRITSSPTKSITSDTSILKISDNATSIDNNTIDDSSPAQEELEQFWLNERLSFFNQTTFNLTRVR